MPPRCTLPSVNSRSSTLIAILAGMLTAGAALVAIVVLTRGDATTTTQAAATTQATSTTAVATTTSTASTTTTTTAPASTTTAGPTTTTIPFEGDTTTKSNATQVGSPGPTLTDVRFGDHGNFVRVVFDFIGSGTPMYDVGYASPPFVGGGSGEAVPVLGSAFLRIQVVPGALYDINTGTLVYVGDTTIDPGMDPVVELQFVDDFEAYMTWVLGLTGQKPFTVEVMQDPLRLVIDVAK